MQYAILERESCCALIGKHFENDRDESQTKKIQTQRFLCKVYEIFEKLPSLEE